MKKNWNDRMRTLLWVSLAFVMMHCDRKTDEAQQDTYTCPMHPTVISQTPGVCPVCAMDLVRKARPGEEVAITEDLTRLLQSPNEVIVSDIKTVRGTFTTKPVTLDVQGIVTYDTRRMNTISARIAGRLEKVYVKYWYQPVKQGMRVVDIYSPELVTAQREYLYVLSSDPENEMLVNAAREKLSLLGMTPEDIRSIEKSKEPQQNVRVLSAFTGYVIPSTTPPPGLEASPAGMNAMGKSNAASATATAGTELMREGNYVNAGDPLFSLVDARSLRVELSVPMHMTSALKVGTRLKLKFLNGEQQQATIDFIQPFMDEAREFVKVRVYSEGVSSLRVGELVQGTLEFPAREALWLPEKAVLDMGTGFVVFVKQRGMFKAKEIKTGVRTDGWVEVSGISSGDEIAADASYLVDSESFVKPIK
jgi:Cu(I)/Ag(I) efflux system membrane fusion protein